MTKDYLLSNTLYVVDIITHIVRLEYPDYITHIKGDDCGEDSSLEEELDQLGQHFEAFTKMFEERSNVMFRRSMVQQQKFNDNFKAEKDLMQELNGDLYSASSHRIAWDFLRIAMFLTTLRMMDTGRFEDTVECADEDFETTIGIISTLSHHNDYIFNVLNKERPEGIATAYSYSAATRTVILDSLSGQFTTEDMKAIAVKIGKTLRTVRRQTKLVIESGEVQMIRAREYKKL